MAGYKGERYKDKARNLCTICIRGTTKT